MSTPYTLSDDCPYCHRPLPEDTAPHSPACRRRALTTWADVAYRWVPHPTRKSGGARKKGGAGMATHQHRTARP